SSEQRSPSDEYAFSQLTAKEFSWLKSLAPTSRLTPEVLLCHGTPLGDTEYFLETVEEGAVRPATSAEVELRLASELAPFIACGHTHVPRVARTKRGQLVVNPGSVGLPAYDDIHPLPHVIETGSPDARYAIAEESKGEWCIALLSFHMTTSQWHDWQDCEADLSGNTPYSRAICHEGGQPFNREDVTRQAGFRLSSQTLPLS